LAIDGPLVMLYLYRLSVELFEVGRSEFAAPPRTRVNQSASASGDMNASKHSTGSSNL
jgi:hypothetical protein